MSRWGWLLAVGCGSEGGNALGDQGGTGSLPTDAARECPSPLSVQLGLGENGFEAAEPGQPVTMVHGPQGGWHVETAGLVSGSTGQVSVRPSLVLDDGTQIAGDQQPQFLMLVDYRDAECDGTFYGVRAFVDDTMDQQDSGTSPMEVICALAGRTATLTMEVGDLSTDETVSASLDLVLELDPRDLDACASR